MVRSGRGLSGIPSTAIGSLGLFIMMFGLLALSGPGRIDIVDGQTRYEVGRSLVDNGDTAIRNPSVWFGVFPGRDGTSQTTYRFPQSLLGAAAVLVADATGMRDESRRHFFFVLTSALAGAALATVYFWWFHRRGLALGRAAFWAAAGVLCTPAWFYSTSTFDDILGALAVTSAVAVAGLGRSHRRTTAALVSGLLIGLAFNCKQPLAVFGLVVAAVLDDPNAAKRARLAILAIVSLGLAVGLAAYAGLDAYKFPPGTKLTHGPLLERYVPLYPGNFPFALVLLLVSPAAGVLWYHPALLLSVEGLRTCWRVERRVTVALGLSVGAFVAFVASMSIFKGDPAWGPRYLTPTFALLWLFAPAGARRLRRFDTVALLLLGLLVQVAALSIDPHRLYVKRGLPSAFGAIVPGLYLIPENSHLVMRPAEIIEVWQARFEPGQTFTPAPTVTSSFPVIDEVERGEPAIRKYKLLNSFRPWWISLRYVPPSQRPIELGATSAILGAAVVAGAMVLFVSIRCQRLFVSLE